jgi:SAM-dependent methyltransferase
MATSLPAVNTGAAYDTVGRYRQDDINGFSRELIFRMLAAAQPAGASSILDAMAGDGNLTLRLADYCRDERIPFPETTVLEFSRVQASFAERELSPLGAKVIWGDVLRMKDLKTGHEIPDGSFDRVLIKSSNHEIPLRDQPALYGSVFRVLRPGGTFVNLGMLFDDPQERDELREIARVKDTFAGMHAAVVNRYFLTRSELYAFLREAGFCDIRAVHPIEYTIRSRIVAEHYFNAADRQTKDLDFQAAQIKAVTLRKRGRLTFEGAESVMRCPGEITVARRPGAAETNASMFHSCPMDIMRRIRAHARLLEEAAKYVRPKTSLLEVGCGIGLFTEHLSQPGLSYLGLEQSEEAVHLCAGRYGQRPGFRFRAQDLNQANLGTSYDAVALLGTINLPNLDAIGVLRKAYDALQKGGRLIVSGLCSRESLTRAEPSILADLDAGGHLAGHHAEIEALREASRRSLTDAGNFWSVEGMVTLLGHLGYSRTLAINKELYYGHAWLVVAEK